MNGRQISPSYSPSLPSFEERPFEEAAPSPIMWEQPQSPGGWSDSTIQLSNDGDSGVEETSDDEYWENVWSTLHREDEETSSSSVSEDLSFQWDERMDESEDSITDEEAEEGCEREE